MHSAFFLNERSRVKHCPPFLPTIVQRCRMILLCEKLQQRLKNSSVLLLRIQWELSGHICSKTFRSSVVQLINELQNLREKGEEWLCYCCLNKKSSSNIDAEGWVSSSDTASRQGGQDLSPLFCPGTTGELLMKIIRIFFFSFPGRSAKLVTHLWWQSLATITLLSWLPGWGNMTWEKSWIISLCSRLLQARGALGPGQGDGNGLPVHQGEVPAGRSVPFSVTPDSV